MSLNNKYKVTIIVETTTFYDLDQVEVRINNALVKDGLTTTGYPSMIYDAYVEKVEIEEPLEKAMIEEPCECKGRGCSTCMGCLGCGELGCMCWN